MLPVRPSLVAALFLLAAGIAAAQSDDAEFQIYGDHPRLFLQTRRLNLLEKERDRQSIRWRQFRVLITGKAAMPEPGFAAALYARVSGDAAYCREAIRWALSSPADLRQTALVYDWCQPELSAGQSATLASALERAIVAARGTPGIAAVRDRTLAAVALAGHAKDLPEQELRGIVQKWWRGEIVPALQGRGDPIGPDGLLPLMEILHAVQDNLNIDLREPVKTWFFDLPIARLFGYFPAPLDAPENDYYIPATQSAAEPDVRAAAAARAADLALVAFDANTQPAGFLQGWLIRDTLLMRSGFGIPYELLWANPYVPGLSFHHAPLFYHDKRLGRLYVRSTWDDDATWLSYRDGKFLQFAGGAPRNVAAPATATLLRLGNTGLYVLPGAATVRAPAAELTQVFLLGLRAETPYEIRIGDGKPWRETADPGGITGFALDEKDDVTIRVRDLRQ